MSMWKKAMFYVGLLPDDDYDNAPPPIGMTPEQGMAPPGTERLQPASGGTGQRVAPVEDFGEPSAVRPLGPMDSRPGPSSAVSSGVGMGSGGLGSLVQSAPTAPTSNINTVRPIPASSSSSTKPHVVSPRAFNDAQEVADRFRAGAPVIMNLQGVDRELSRRLIDFASGMCYGLHGKMEKVGDRVYLLTPVDVELSPEHRRELHEQGLHSG